MLLEFKNKFKLAELAIYENEFWCLSIRPSQVTFCSLVLSAKDEIDTFAALQDDALLSLKEVYRIIEKIKNELNAVKVNYITLMLVDDLLHTHVFFRFAEPFTFADKTYVDDVFPWPLDVSSISDISTEAVRAFIEQFIR